MSKSRLVTYAAALVFISALFYVPLVGILTFSVGSFSGPIDGFASPRLWSTVGFTVGQALVSTFGSVVLGLPVAYLLYRRRLKGQQFARTILTVPFILPVLVIAIAFSTFRFSNTSVSATILIIAAHIFINLSLVVRTVGSAWQSLGDDQDQAAELDGAGRFRTFWAINLPALRPAIAASATLVFAYTASSFGVVLILGGGLVSSIETDIYQAALVYLDLNQAALLALVQLVVTALAFTASEVFAKQTAINLTDSVDATARGKKLDRRDWPVMLFGFTLALFFVLPIWNVFQKAFTFGDAFSLQNFGNLLNDDVTSALDISVGLALTNSVRNICIATVASVAIGTAVAWLLARSPRNMHMRILDFAYLAPVGVSTVLLGLGYLVTFSTEPFALRSSWLVVPLVETLLALPLVVRLMYSALRNLDPEVLEAASIDGAKESTRFWLVELPLVRPTLEVAVGFAAIIALGDFGASAFLAFGDQETLPLVLYRLFSHPGATNYGMALALSALLIVVTGVTLMAISLRSRRQK